MENIKEIKRYKVKKSLRCRFFMLNYLMAFINYFNYKIFMATYEGWVRVPLGPGNTGTRVVKVQVEANSAGDAAGILRGQYGYENVVGIPSPKQN